MTSTLNVLFFFQTFYSEITLRSNWVLFVVSVEYPSTTPFVPILCDTLSSLVYPKKNTLFL